MLIEALLAHAHLPYLLRDKRVGSPNHEQDIKDAQDCIDQYGDLIKRLRRENPDIVVRIMDRRYPPPSTK